MVWGQTIPLFLLTVLHGVCCGGLFDAECRADPCQCGSAANIVCTLTHPIAEITLKHNDTRFLSHKLPEKKGRIEDDKMTIEWTEHQVALTIPKVTYSDKLTYDLTLYAQESKGYDIVDITIRVSGLCEPEMSKNIETKELECVTESEKDTSIVWMDDHRKVYRATRTPTSETLNNGYKLRSFLELTEEIGENICCSVSYRRIDGVYEEEKKTCLPNTSAIGREELPSRTNPSLYVIFALLAVALVAAAFGYLLKRRSRMIVRAASRRSEGPLIPAEPIATEATTESV